MSEPAADATPVTVAAPADQAGGTALRRGVLHTAGVAMQNIAFNPSTIHAKVGQTIKWTNDDSVDHNVTATSGETFKSSNFGQGSTYSTKLTKAGTIQYVCTIHPGMTGTIVVTK